MQAVVGIGHWALRARDFEGVLAFYRDKLGFAEMFRLERDGKTWIVYLRVTDSQFLEIFPEAVGDRAPGRDAVGMNHICLEVADLDTAVAAVEKAGLALLRPITMGLDHNRQAWLEDPDGNRIELMEIGPNSMQREAIARLRG